MILPLFKFTALAVKVVSPLRAAASVEVPLSFKVKLRVLPMTVLREMPVPVRVVFAPKLAVPL